jgi:hypothetical protein
MVDVAVGLTLKVEVKVKDKVGVNDGVWGTGDGVCVPVGVGGEQNASDTVKDANDTLSRLGPPSAVRASSVIMLYPAARFTITDDSSHTVQPPVERKSSTGTCITPFTDTDTLLLFALPLAYLKDSCSACAAVEVREKESADPRTLSKLA